MDTITYTFKRFDPIWYFETSGAEPVPAIFIHEAKHKGVTIELAGSRQKTTSYARITRREVVEVE